MIALARQHGWTVGRGRRCGFTLVELVVTVAVMAVIMLGMGSAMLIVSHAVPTADNPAGATIAAAQVADEIAAELQYAVSFTVRDVNAVEFSVADRDLDTLPETIRYAWSGAPGAPLTRQVNGGTIVNVVDGVCDFCLGYGVESVTTTEESSGPTTSPEILLASFEGWSGLSGSTYGGAPFKGDTWTAEYFTVTGVPAEATVLTISRVELEMAQSSIGTGDSFSVAIHECIAAGDPEPAVSPLGTPVIALESSLGTSFEWREFTFSDINIGSPSDEYVIVVKGTSSDINYDGNWMRWTNSAAPADSTIARWSTDSGAKWDPKANKQDDYDHVFRVYGTYETPGEEPVEVTRHFLTSINIRLRVGSDAATQVDGGVRILNAPEVTP